MQKQKGKAKSRIKIKAEEATTISKAELKNQAKAVIKQREATAA